MVYKSVLSHTYSVGLDLRPAILFFDVVSFQLQSLKEMEIVTQTYQHTNLGLLLP